MTSQTANLFDIKSISLDLLVLLLKETDIQALSESLEHSFGQAKESDECFVLDLEAISTPQTLDLSAILPLLRRYGIRVVALRHSDLSYRSLAKQYDLAFLPGIPRSTIPNSEAALKWVANTTKRSPSPKTLYIDRPVRTGQQIYAKEGDLVVLAVVSAGAEVIADGNIHVYAPLRGRALAGARGNTAARIFTRSMEAELVSIAGVYRTIEQALPESINNQPTQIFLDDQRLVMIALTE